MIISTNNEIRFYPHIPDQDVPQLLAKLHFEVIVDNVLTDGLNGKQ
jgi:hypothetical protein